MKNINSKFDNFIRSINYPCIKHTSIDVEEIKQWAHESMPGVVLEMEQLGWDLTNDTTWLENTFCNHVLQWYNKRIAVFITPSLFEFVLCKRQLKTKVFASFRERFKLDLHLDLLVHPIIFLRPVDLDDLYVSFNFDRGYAAIDYSHCDEDGELEESYIDEFSWLSNQDDMEWTADQVARAYKEEVYE